MLIDIYYIIGIFILLSIISKLLIFNKLLSIVEWYEKFEKVTGNKPVKSDFDKESDYSLFISSFPLIAEGFWIIFGLITNNWFIFLFLMVYSKLSGMLFKKTKYSLFSKFVFMQNLLVKSSLYGFMIINNFHLKLDLLKLFKDFLQSL
jgi:hypothetical protein